jgi:hypothetical protein
MSTHGAAPVAIWERDLWLVRAVQCLRPVVNRAGLALPKRVTVKAGPTQTAGDSSLVALGECWPSSATKDGVPGIIINPSMTDAITILSTLIHELVHAADNCGSGHGPWFAAWARAIGLEGAVPSTHAGPALQRTLRVIAQELGAYPAPQHGYNLAASGRVFA